MSPIHPADAVEYATEERVEIDLTGLVLPEHVEATGFDDDGRTADFVIQPLERGYGYTLGNSVRRALVSSLRGAAIWAFRIDGVVHEHQTIQGVVEDVHQVIQNLKALVLTLDDDVDEAKLTLHVERGGPVTAADINPSASVQILDPGQHILTVEGDRSLSMELYVNKGRGFVLSDQHPRPEGAPVDLVPVDAIYNPVRRANFTVEETRVGERTDFDRLSFRVETDGSIRPEQAMANAAELVRRYLEYMLNFSTNGVPESPAPGTTPLPARIRTQLARPIEELTEISVRSRNSLQKENLRTLGDLVRRTQTQILNIDNFGQKSMEELLAFLGEHSIELGMPLTVGPDGEWLLADDAAAGSGESSGD